METKILKSPVTRLKSPVTRLKSPVTRLKSPIKRIVDTSNIDTIKQFDCCRIETTESLTRKNLISNKIKSYDPYKITIFKDLKNQLYREKMRMKLDVQVNQIIKSRTINIETNDGYIKKFLFNQCRKWFQIRNPFIFIESGTGTGKTTFVEDFIKIYNLRALIITNRAIAKEQLKNRLEIVEFTDMISVTSYQAIEENFNITLEYLDSFDVIILDELHYFISDSLMNNTTNIGYKKILSTQNVMKIGLSATISDIRYKIIGDLLIDNDDYVITNERIFNYYMNNNASKIANIYCYDNLENLVLKIINNDEKWLFFVDSIEQGNEILNNLLEKGMSEQQVVFLNKKEINKKNNKLARQMYQEIVKENKFSCKVFICTKIMDNAVNIIDRDLKNVVLSEDDKVTFLQMLGRKRCIDEMDTFNLYISTGNKNRLIRRRNKNMSLKKYMEKVAFSLENTTKINPKSSKNGEDADEYRKCITVNTYKNKHELNTLGYIKVQCDIRDQDELINTDIFDTKVSWVLNYLNFKPLIVDSRAQSFIDEILDFVDKPIQKSNREVKVYINKTFKKYYGLDGSDDDYESISLKRLQSKFNKKGLPLKIRETKRRFIIELEKSE